MHTVKFCIDQGRMLWAVANHLDKANDTTDLGHVGMYIGNNQWIESSFTGDTVRISNVPWGYVGRARRIL